MLCFPILAGCAARPEASTTAPVRAKTIADAVAAAQAGDTIVLPAGTYDAPLVLPAGVSLRGAGMGKTVLDARKTEVGLTVDGGEGAEVSDLTIRGASRSDLLAKGARKLTIRRVRTTRSLSGINLTDVSDGRVENVVSDDNRYGLVVSGAKNCTVVNCTLAQNASLGLSLASGDGLVAFNCCFSANATAVYLGEAAKGLRLDHNVYDSLFAGKMAGQLGRKSIGEWRSLSGEDAHSVQVPTTFRDTSRGNYRPAGTLSWALDRAPTSDWGTEELGGIKAPERDADDASRVGPYDVGAFESAPEPPRRADGRLTVRNPAGVKSAGLFAPGGYEVAYLFHDLPLAPGSYPFWFPSRDFQGRSIPPGTYELKTAESALEWEYLRWIGDTGEAWPTSKSAAVAPSFVLFDGGGRLIVAQGWSEDMTNVRAYDAATGRWLWAFPGQSYVSGLTLGSEGALALLKFWDKDTSLAHIDPKTGKIVPWKGQNTGIAVLDASLRGDGLAELDGRLYLCDAAKNVIRIGAANPPRFDRSVTVPGPSGVVADLSVHRLWAISEGRRMLALDAEGRVEAEASPVPAPVALAVRDGRLAVASRKTGMVHLFDARDPNHLKPLRTFGTGDGPFGPFRPDRFLFQSAPGVPGSTVYLALGPKGELAVTDENRLGVFDAEGKLLWSTFGLFGGGMLPAYDAPQQIFEIDGRKSLRLDEKNVTWAPDGNWDVPPGKWNFLGIFADGGRRFGAFVSATPGQKEPDLLMTQLEGTTFRPKLLLCRDPKNRQYLARKDSNRDGRIDASDNATVLSPPSQGPHPLRNTDMFHREDTFLQPNGDLVALNLNGETFGVHWRRSGLDPDGVPIYRLRDCVAMPRHKTYRSPYTFQPDEPEGLGSVTLESGGDYIGLIHMRTAPGGVGVLNHAGTDVAGIDARGDLRWMHTLSRHKGLEGLSTAGPVTITTVGTTSEVIALNRDGLGLGTFGQGPDLHYFGYFIDHPQAVRLYRGLDKRIYALLADNITGRLHWWRLRGEDRIATTATPVTLSASNSEALAALPAPAPQAQTKPVTPIIRIPRLNRDLPIDGDLKKWREAGVVPQVIVTPETAAGAIDGPEDVSAVIRLAYRGENLYLQFLVFDDFPSFHQPTERHYKQDGVEFCINGFHKGFKFDLTQTTDAGPIVYRSRFYFQKLDWLIPATQAPRVVKVLKDAKDVSERTLIESVFGLDLSACRVIVSEVKLPINAQTYQGSPESLVSLQPGQTFRIGFLINDNDDPGSDVQNYLVWPASYGNFNPVEDSAIAELE